MSRNFLRGLSLWIAMGSGALLAYGDLRIHYLESLMRARRLRPDMIICANGYIETMVAAMTAAALLALVLTELFWRCYGRLPSPVDSAPRARCSQL